MKPSVKHVYLPLIAPLMIVCLYFTPVAIISCKARGWVALTIALLSANAAFVAIWYGYGARFRRDPIWRWWFCSAVIFTSPLVLLLGPLG